MAFESLSEKLQNVFKNLRGKGRLSGCKDRFEGSEDGASGSGC